MPEFRRWAAYYRAYPFDDLHRYHRPAALVAAVNAKDRNRAVVDNLDWLFPEPGMEGFSDADARTMRAFGIKPNTEGK